jgi:hypothetical protein
MGWLGFSRNIQSTESGIRYRGNRELVHERGHTCTRANATMPQSGFRRQLTELQSRCGYRRRSRSLLSCSLAVAQTKMITLETPMGHVPTGGGTVVVNGEVCDVGFLLQQNIVASVGVLFPGRRRKMAREWGIDKPTIRSQSGQIWSQSDVSLWRVQRQRGRCGTRRLRGLVLSRVEIVEARRAGVEGRYIEVIPARSMMALGSGDNPKLSTSSVSLADGMDCWGNIGGRRTQRGLKALEPLWATRACDQPHSGGSRRMSRQFHCVSGHLVAQNSRFRIDPDISHHRISAASSFVASASPFSSRQLRRRSLIAAVFF